MIISHLLICIICYYIVCSKDLHNEEIENFDSNEE